MGADAIHPLALDGREPGHPLDALVHRRLRNRRLIHRRRLRAALEKHLDRLDRPARILAAHPVPEEGQRLIAGILIALLLRLVIDLLPDVPVARGPLGAGVGLAMQLIGDAFPGHAARAQLGGNIQEGEHVGGHRHFSCLHGFVGWVEALRNPPLFFFMVSQGGWRLCATHHAGMGGLRKASTHPAKSWKEEE